MEDDGKPCTARRRLHPALGGWDGHGRPGRQGDSEIPCAGQEPMQDTTFQTVI